MLRSASSLLIFSISKPVNFWSLVSNIALAWTSSKLYSCLSFPFASSDVFDFFINVIALSMSSKTFDKPKRRCCLFLDLSKSYFVLLRTTSTWCFKYNRKISLRFNNFGWPLSKAIILKLKDCWSCVCLYKLLRVTNAFASFFSSITMRIPFLFDSSLRSVIPSITLSLTSVAIFSIKFAIRPSITSPRLCGGMFVAIPTAMPVDPFTNKLGYLDGKTFGSDSLPS